MKVRALGSTDDPAQEVAVAGINIAAGVVALVMLGVTRTITTVAAQTGAVQLLAANPGRLAAIVRNDSTTNLHVDEALIAGGPASGERVIAPTFSFEVNENNKGVIDAWFEGSPTGQATVTELN